MLCIVLYHCFECLCICCIRCSDYRNLPQNDECEESAKDSSECGTGRGARRSGLQEHWEKGGTLFSCHAACWKCTQQHSSNICCIFYFQLRNLDPFLMLDEFRVSKPAGFPDHPHRGFETVRLCECVTKDLQVPDSQVWEFAALPSCVWSFCLGGGSNQFCIFPLENYENSFSVLQHLIDKKRKYLKFAFLKSKSATGCKAAYECTTWKYCSCQPFN